MEGPDRATQQTPRLAKGWRLLAIWAILVNLCITVIPAPVAALPRVATTSQLQPRGLPTTVVVPLYIYPSNGAWNPLYNALNSHPHLNFLIIINPANGPGSTQYPSQDYINNVQRLNTFSNVKLIGYVRVSWATKSIDAVRSEINRYAGWNQYNNGAMAMNGIFFDETPNWFTSTTANYVQTIHDLAANADGIRSPRTIVYNPGSVPDGRFLANPPADTIIVVFEAGLWELSDARRAEMAALPNGRSKYSYIIHSVPDDTNLGSLVDGLSYQAQYLFLTDLDENFYESFGGRWSQFIDAVPT